MTVMIPSEAVRRAAVVDLGSNSVRMVVYEGIVRNPVPIFNEKATIRLGEGLEATGRLSEEGISRAMDVLGRFQVIAHTMGAAPFDVLATAAVRDAENGPDFVEAAKRAMPDARFRVLNGEEEADYSAAGVLCALPDADGVAADIGGGSLELIRVAEGAYFEAVTTPLGVIRLRERSKGSIEEATQRARNALEPIEWLGAVQKRPLYLVGGAFRALARLYVARVNYPLNMVHLLKVSTEQAREMAEWASTATRKQIEKVGNVPRKRMADAPFAAVALLSLLKRLKPSEVIFSAEGLREGWYMRDVASAVSARDPMLSLAGEMAGRLGRNASLPAALEAWTSPVFVEEQGWADDIFLSKQHHLACLFSDVGSYDHPQFRAEQTYRRILYSHGVGFEHTSRAFLALVLAVRYEIDMAHPILETSRALLTKTYFQHALHLGMALRLAYALCAGTDVLLESTRLRIEGRTLALDLGTGSLRSAGSSVKRRLERLADALGLDSIIREK